MFYTISAANTREYHHTVEDAVARLFEYFAGNPANSEVVARLTDDRSGIFVEGRGYVVLDNLIKWEPPIHSR